MMMHNYLGDNLFDEDWADSPLMREYFGKGNFLYGKHAKHLLRTDVRETEDAIDKLSIRLEAIRKRSKHPTIKGVALKVFLDGRVMIYGDLLGIVALLHL